MNIKMVGYCRVSTEDQVVTGVSLDVQEEKIRAYCKAKDWDLVEIVRDEGISAKNLKRPGLQSILSMLPKRVNRGFDGIIVLKLDRLTRNVKDLAILNEEFKKYKVAFISIGESVDTSTAMGELYHNIIASVSQWERKVISERTRDALRYKRRMGQRAGEVPYGYKLDVDKKSLIPIPDEQKILEEIKNLRKNGDSYFEIALHLNIKGVETKKGKRWFPATVHSVLRYAA